MSTEKPPPICGGLAGPYMYLETKGDGVNRKDWQRLKPLRQSVVMGPNTARIPNLGGREGCAIW